jgi:hypothetical protein
MQTGRVASVTPIDHPAGMRAVMVLPERDGTERRREPNDHAGFQAAAGAGPREVRFSSGMPDGHRVPFSLRMTVAFAPPATPE